MKKGRLGQIVDIVKKKRGLPEDFTVSSALVRKRINRGSIVNAHKGSGQVSPLLPLEPHFVSIILKMAQMGESLTPSKSIALINNIIQGTKHQKELIDWKKKFT